MIAQLMLAFLSIALVGCSTVDVGGLPEYPTGVTSNATLSGPSPAAIGSGLATDPVYPSPTPTLVPPTPLPASSPTPEEIVLTFAKDAFCRKGPGEEYFDSGSFNRGDSTQAEGRSETDPRWWFVVAADGAGRCWVSDTTVEPNETAEFLPVQEPLEALPQTPPDLWADRICKANGFLVTLNWTPSWTADGYYVYLDGGQVQDIKDPTRTSYVMKLEMKRPVSYGLEAYNSVGYGEKIIIDDPGCP
jgi:hypothetical protein